MVNNVLMGAMVEGTGRLSDTVLACESSEGTALFVASVGVAVGFF